MIVRYLSEDDYEVWNHFVDQSPQGFCGIILGGLMQ